MMKIIGAVIVCLSSAALGYKKSVMIEQRLDILNEFEKSLILLKGEIKYSAASLPEATESVYNRTFGYIKSFYEKVSKDLSNNIELTIKQIWEDNARLCFKEEFIDAEDLNVITELGTQLGHLDVSMQLRAIELCMNRLKERQLAATKEIKDKSRLYKTMGVAGGVLITLVLF